MRGAISERRGAMFIKISRLVRGAMFIKISRLVRGAMFIKISERGD